MTKKVLFGDESRKELLSGVEKIASATKVTMGAAGRCVMIGNAVYGNDGMVPLPTIVTKDGVTVCRHFQLENPVEHRGAMLIREAAEKTVYEAGDATTATVVLAEALIKEGLELVNKGASSPEVKKGIDEGIEYVVEKLKEASTPVRGDFEKVKHIATVSSNNDTFIGGLITEAFEKIGFDGVIEIEKSNTTETSVKVSEGLKFDRGWVSPLFVNNGAKETCEFDNPYILLYDKKINHHTQVQKAVELCMQNGKPLLIICEDAEQEGLAFLAMNNYQKRIQVCVVKSPEFGEMKREWMEDIALLTGGNYISDIRGNDIKKVKLDDFGKARRVVVTKTETIIIESEGSKSDIEELINDLKMNLTQAVTEDEKSLIEKRIARLTGGIAVIQVGGATETELNEKLDRVDDAVRATKSAIAEGFIPGGGAALLNISLMDLDKDPVNKDGFMAVLNAIKKPFLQICENAGVDYKTIQYDPSKKRIGYNVLSGKVEDMVESGIIDSTKAIRCALVNAASVAGMFITSECSIITIH